MAKTTEKPEGLFGTDIPVGGIIMYAGNLEDLDAGTWALCDGKVHNGKQTPNLVDRLPIGTADATQVGNANEGKPTHTHGFTRGQQTGQEPGPNNQQPANQNSGSVASGYGHVHKLDNLVTDETSSLPPVTRVYFIQRIG
jgi:hypothetical protein